MRTRLKRQLTRAGGRRPARGATVLIYHRVGAGSPDERDVAVEDFAAQVEALAAYDVLSLDAALDRLDAGDERPSVVLTFDDGFGDVYDHGWPLLRSAGLPFTVYVASGYVGSTMHWEGSTAKAAGPALTWDQLGEMVASGLCTIGNHTRSHVRPEQLGSSELDACTADLEDKLGVTPRHFAYTWGIPVPDMESELRRRFRSATTGELGRCLPATDRILVPRIPVRRTDPIEFFRAKLSGSLLPERAYSAIVSVAKRAGARA
jgi:peptidoglycan/xylan/chitin deacetylase (PgdA/CDA1 family)